MNREYGVGEQIITPQQRTADFFNREYTKLEADLIGRKITILGSPRAVMITAARGFSILENNGIYRKGFEEVSVDTIGNGVLWAFPDRRFRTQVPLIGASEQGQPGACIQIRAASKFNPKAEKPEEKFIPIKTQRELLEYLGLKPNEVANLEFRDQTNILYLVKKSQSQVESEIQTEQLIDSTEANNFLLKLIDGE